MRRAFSRGPKDIASRTEPSLDPGLVLHYHVHDFARALALTPVRKINHRRTQTTPRTNLLLQLVHFELHKRRCDEISRQRARYLECQQEMSLEVQHGMIEPHALVAELANKKVRSRITRTD